MLKVGKKIKFNFCGKVIEGVIIEIREGEDGRPERVRIKTPKGSKVWRRV